MSSVLESLASSTLRGAGIRATVESNITPKVEVYNARDQGPSLLESLGVQTHIVVTDASGRVLTEIGQKPHKDYLLLSVYATLFAFGVFSVYKLFRR